MPIHRLILSRQDAVRGEAPSGKHPGFKGLAGTARGRRRGAAEALGAATGVAGLSAVAGICYLLTIHSLEAIASVAGDIHPWRSPETRALRR
jgi:hypothetical protein